MNALTDKLADKLVFLLISVFVYLQVNTDASAVVYVFAAVFASALGSYIERPNFRTAILVAYVALCLPYPGFCFFLPLIALDGFALPWPWLVAATAVPLLTHAATLGLPLLPGLALLILLAGYVQRRTSALTGARRQAHTLRDAAQESALREARQREALLTNQDAEVRLATLRERNRIAREIHDHVGHQLASAILQLGALMAVCRDTAFRSPLEQLKTTLVDSMEQIRTSVHDLHDQSVDLEAEVRRMTDDFRFCPLKLDYDICAQPPPAVRYALLAIIQEGLANIMRHSAASEARLTLREHPGFYQLILRDNGPGGRITNADASGRTMNAPASGSVPEAADGAGPYLPRPGSAGMGLRNIEERVASFGGHAHFQKRHGFTVFVTIPRENMAAGNDRKAEPDSTGQQEARTWQQMDA